MARFFVFIFVVGGLIVSLYATKPTKADYLTKLEERAASVALINQDAYAQLRGRDPFDEMVSTQSPFQLLERTRFNDYVVFTVFTTEYETPGYGARRIRSYGFFSTLVSVRKE